MNLVNQVVLVPGGTGLLGWLIVQELLHASARVIVTARDEARYSHRIKQVPNLTSHLEFVAADLREPGEVERVLDTVSSEHGRIDRVIHAAGTPPGPPRTFAQVTAGEFEEAWRSNVTTAFLVARGVAGAADGDHETRLVLIGSRLTEYRDHPPLAIHLACRAAVASLGDALAAESAATGLRCNVLCPGLLDSQANRQAFSEVDAGVWSKPGEVARYAVMLAAEEARGLSGAHLPA